MRNHGKQTPPEASNRQERPQLIQHQEKQVAEQRPGVLELTAAEEKTVRQLRDRNREVKTHERAHLASAGQYARGGPTYSYEQKSDGRRYAVGGEVPIDVSAEKTPEETLQKMQAVKRIALAPAEPSPADRSIAVRYRLEKPGPPEIAT